MMLPAPADLIERLRNGDEHAFGELVSDLAPRLLRIARQYVKDDATAEEIVQETWIAVLNGLDRFAGQKLTRIVDFSNHREQIHYAR